MHVQMKVVLFASITTVWQGNFPKEGYVSKFSCCAIFATNNDILGSLSNYLIHLLLAGWENLSGLRHSVEVYSAQKWICGTWRGGVAKWKLPEPTTDWTPFEKEAETQQNCGWHERIWSHSDLQSQIWDEDNPALFAVNWCQPKLNIYPSAVPTFWRIRSRRILLVKIQWCSQTGNFESWN